MWTSQRATLRSLYARDFVELFPAALVGGAPEFDRPGKGALDENMALLLRGLGRLGGLGAARLF